MSAAGIIAHCLSGGWRTELLADNPWYYYKLDETSTVVGTVITDYSGNARHGEIVSGQLLGAGSATGWTAQEAGLIGASTYSFEATGNATQMSTCQPFIDGAATLTAGTPFAFTVVAIVNTTANTSPSYQIISSDIGPTSSQRHFQTYLNQGKPGIALLKGDNTADVLLSTTNIADGTSHMLHFVYDGSLGDLDSNKLRIYIDGALDTSKATTFVPDPPNGFRPRAIDRGSNGDYFGFVGNIDEMLYYDTALSSARVLAHFTARDS